MLRCAAFGIVLGLVACASPSEGDHLVAELPNDPWWFSVSEGGRSAAYAERRAADAFLTVDGRRYGPFA
jgi:hypothetical protein